MRNSPGPSAYICLEIVRKHSLQPVITCTKNGYVKRMGNLRRKNSRKKDDITELGVNNAAVLAADVVQPVGNNYYACIRTNGDLPRREAGN